LPKNFFRENGPANGAGSYLVPDAPLTARSPFFHLHDKPDHPKASFSQMKHHHGHPEHTDSTAPTDTLQTLPHEDITKCARELWAQQGCPEGRDEAIWLEAESRLLASRRGASRSLPAVGSVR